MTATPRLIADLLLGIEIANQRCINFQSTAHITVNGIVHYLVNISSTEVHIHLNIYIQVHVHHIKHNGVIAARMKNMTVMVKSIVPQVMGEMSISFSVHIYLSIRSVSVNNICRHRTEYWPLC